MQNNWGNFIDGGGLQRIGVDMKMILSQGKLADALLKELMEVIYRYDESIYMVTVLGVLRLVETQLIEDHSEDDDD